MNEYEEDKVMKELIKDYERLEAENKMLKTALNCIGIMAMGPLAYTPQFTDEAMEVCRKALGLEEKKWPY